MKYLSSLCILIFPLFTSAQTAQDSAELRILVDSAYYKLFVSTDSARMLAEEAMAIAADKGMFSYELNALQTIGFSHFYEYDFDKAIEVFKAGLEKAKQRSDLSTESSFQNSLAMVYEQISEFPSAVKHYQRSFEIDSIRNDSANICISLGNLANTFQSMGKTDSAILLHKQAIEIRESRKDPNVHNNYNNLGTIYHQNGRYNLAIDLYLKAAEKRGELGETDLEADTYGNLGALFSSIKNHDKSIFYIKKAEGFYRKTNNLRKLATNHTLQGVEYHRIKDNEKARENFTKALELSKEIGDVKEEATSYHNLATIYADLEQLDLAIANFEKSLELKTQLENESIMPVTLIELGNVLSKDQDFKKGESFLLRGFDQAKNQKNIHQQENAAHKLGEHYERIGNLPKALYYQRLTNSLGDSLFNDDYISKMNQLYVAFETEQTKSQLLDEQLKSQQLEKAKTEADLKIAQRNSQLIGSLGGLLVLLLGGGFLFYRNKQKEKEKIATVKIEEQQKGLAAVIHAQEEERKRIAKDLHDGIVQQLGGLKLGLQRVLPIKSDPDAKKMMKILDDSAQELREISHRMMPRALSDLGLVPALRDMLENSLGHSEIGFEFETFGISDFDRFEERIEISLYRIVQELINNVIKHSGANQVNIQLIKSGNHLALIVEDNGKGFSTNTPKSGIGLMNISSRLDTLNGQVNFEPSPEGGTLATINIPLA
jgi:signal transduction histidine kinase